MISTLRSFNKLKIYKLSFTHHKSSRFQLFSSISNQNDSKISEIHSIDNQKSEIDFSNASTAYKNKSFLDLCKAFLVFSICQQSFLVRNANTIMGISYRVMGSNFTNWIMKKTFFGHFCAGENEITIKPTVQYLNANGVGAILDYAAESDIVEAIPSNNEKYSAHNEAICDMNKEIFEKCIKAVKNVSPTGFAAIKCTALGNPELLKRASSALVELKRLFQKFDIHNTGSLCKEDFITVYNMYFKSGDVEAIFDKIDMDHNGRIDYLEWSNGLELEELHLLTNHCRESGPLSAAVLDEHERKLMGSMRKRLDDLVSLASSLGVRLMIDAEHTYFQPAIDNITINLMKKYNKSSSFPVIFSTYQMYLKDSLSRLNCDMDRAKKGDFIFAAKLVRGAYMVQERQFAKDHNLEDPIHSCIEDTHKSYNSGMKAVLSNISQGLKFEVMIASHNQNSIELTIAEMKNLKLDPSKSGIYFGQLLGMSDHVTFSLGHAKYLAYKYVPYGIIREVMPYLIRRAQENADALSGAKLELNMISSELKRRIMY